MAVAPAPGRVAKGKLVACEQRADGAFELDFEIVPESQLTNSDKVWLFAQHSYAVEEDPAFAATLPVAKMKMDAWRAERIRRAKMAANPV
ncbi:MAG: hypothetical protein J0H40_19370 [Rhizobiales bacterium]|nr:hypothetical protein [Hyphomicrobiales bacterium]